MGKRRRRIPVNRHADGERSSIGDDDVQHAVDAIHGVMHAEIAMNVERGFTAMNALHMFFPDDLADRLRAVRHCVTPQSDIGDYPIGGQGIKAHVDWSNSGIPTPSVAAMQPHRDRMELFHIAIQTVRDARIKYGKVVQLLRWFNANATPSATRHYWPSALALVPGSKFAIDNAETPSRYSAPNNIGHLLPLLRETAGTVAGMQLFPKECKGRRSNEVWLTFQQTEIMTEDLCKVPLDAIHVNL